MAQYKVDGYLFDSEEMARQAKREADGVRYIREKTRMNNPDVIMKLYNRLLDQEMFETEVGIAFLRELQEYLETIPYIKREDIRPIPVKGRYDDAPEQTRPVRRRKRKIAVDPEREEIRYRKAFRVALFFCVVLSAAIIGMFTITHLSGNSVTILNYEEKLIDKYEEWEKELSEREAEVKLREDRVQSMLNPTDGS